MKMRIFWLFVAAFLSVTTFSLNEAMASVCVVVDVERDNLSAEQQAAARAILLSAFEEQGLSSSFDGEGCTETHTVYHIKFGKLINVTVTGPRGVRTARASTLEDLPNHYSQIAKSLVTGASMATGGGAINRNNVTREQAAPRRVHADNLKYATIGYGAVSAGRVAFGPAFGFGYRKELDLIGLDISFANLLLANDSTLSDGINGSFLRLIVVVYKNPIADYSLYYGGGFSYGGTAVTSNGEVFSGSGLQGELTVGFEAFRSSSIRGFIQANLTLPFYKSSSDDRGSKYTPIASLNLGFGWGKPANIVRVIND